MKKLNPQRLEGIRKMYARANYYHPAKRLLEHIEALESERPTIAAQALRDEANRADDHGLPLYTALARERMRNRADELETR